MRPDHDVDQERDAVLSKGQGSRSLLESQCITPSGAEFLEELDLLTAEHREARAREHEDKAREAARGHRELSTVLRERGKQQDADVLTGEENAALATALAHFKSKQRWHRDRARGQRERIAKVKACGSTKVTATCLECEDIQETKGRCDIGRVCGSCRGRTAQRAKVRFAEARQRVVVAAHRYGLLAPWRGRWSEKLLTLTAPHVGTPSERIERIFKAWKRFATWLQTGWRDIEKRLGMRPVYYRAFEWTLGHDHQGHPHFHVWLLSPFIDFEQAREAWRRALVGAGVPFADDQQPVIDIKAVHSRPAEMVHEVLKGANALKFSRLQIGTAGEDAVAYAVGWCIVDAEGVTADVRAEIYRALEGRRLNQGSRGFLGAYLPSCRTCGVIHARKHVCRQGHP